MQKNYQQNTVEKRPVDGTYVERKRRVVYALTATAIQDFKD
jgi:hypothetical protein